MKNFALLFLLALVYSCSNTSIEEPPIFVFEEEKQQVEELMKQQEKAWNSGSIDAFMHPYWNSDSLLFIGSRGLNYGWNTTLSNYKESYPDTKTMGRLVFENDKIKALPPHGIWIAGRWNLFRETDTLRGSYLLIWEKIDEEWKIIADHSSKE